MTTPETLLFVSGGGRSFRKRELTELTTALEQQDANTLLMPATSASELVLDRFGRLPDGFRFASSALRQVCGLLAPGLFRALADLSGTYRRPNTAREDYSPAEAIHVYNAVLKRRFATRLDGVRLVRHLGEQRIDGVIGPRFRWLDNRTFLEAISDAVAQAPMAAQFSEASLSGRRLALRFRGRAEILNHPDTGTISPGYFFVNSEIGGDSSVQGAHLVLASQKRRFALGPFVSGGRLAHIGRQFEQKLQALCDRVFETPPSIETMRAAFGTLLTRTLEISEDRDERREQLQKLARRLNKRGAPVRLARQVVERVVYGGTNEDSELPFLTARRDFDAITGLMLYNALSDTAKSLSPLTRERLERAAYALLRSPSL